MDILLSTVQPELILRLHKESTIQWQPPHHPVGVIEGVITQGEAHISPVKENTPRWTNSEVCSFAMEIPERKVDREEVFEIKGQAERICAKPG
jgi:hypothetical protein